MRWNYDLDYGQTTMPIGDMSPHLHMQISSFKQENLVHVVMTDFYSDDSVDEE